MTMSRDLSGATSANQEKPAESDEAPVPPLCAAEPRSEGDEYTWRRFRVTSPGSMAGKT